MRAIAISLVIAVLALPAHARGARFSAGDTECPDKIDAPAKPPARLRAVPATRDSARPPPTVHGDAAEPQRLQSPRWHSFLPGMIR